MLRKDGFCVLRSLLGCLAPRCVSIPVWIRTWWSPTLRLPTLLSILFFFFFFFSVLKVALLTLAFAFFVAFGFSLLVICLICMYCRQYLNLGWRFGTNKIDLTSPIPYSVVLLLIVLRWWFVLFIFWGALWQFSVRLLRVLSSSMSSCYVWLALWTHCWESESCLICSSLICYLQSNSSGSNIFGAMNSCSRNV